MIDYKNIIEDIKKDFEKELNASELIVKYIEVDGVIVISKGFSRNDFSVIEDIVNLKEITSTNIGGDYSSAKCYEIDIKENVSYIIYKNVEDITDITFTVYFFESKKNT